MNDNFPCSLPSQAFMLSTPWTVKQGLCCSAAFEFLGVASKFKVSFQSRLAGLSVTFSDFQFSPSERLSSVQNPYVEDCRGLYLGILGLNWVAPAKARNQLAKAGRKLGEDHRHRRESVAKVDD